MEIIPVIVNALMIVAALAFVTITFSYFRNKIKLKKRVFEPPENRTAQPVVHVERSVKRIVEGITKPIPPPPKRPALPKSEIEQKIKLDPSTKRPVKSIEEKIPKHRSKLVNSERLEIVKSLKPNPAAEELTEKKPGKPTAEKKNSAEEKNMASLDDMILDKYADNEPGDMYTLNTKKRTDLNK